MPPKVCARIREFRDKKEALLQIMFPREMYTGVAFVKSEIESCYSANYTAFNEEEETLIYEAMWVMRVSEL